MPSYFIMYRSNTDLYFRSPKPSCTLFSIEISANKLAIFENTKIFQIHYLHARSLLCQKESRSLLKVPHQTSRTMLRTVAHFPIQ